MRRFRRAKLVRASRNDSLVNRLAEKHGNTQQAVLPMLRSIAADRGALTPNALGATADATHTPDAQVAGVASFYSLLPSALRSGTPLRLCDGPVCQLHNVSSLRSDVEAAVGDDQHWSVGRTSCLGLCDRAPAALVGCEACGPISAGRVESMLRGWRGKTRHYEQPLVGEARIAMSRVGKIDPNSYESAREAGAYQVLELALMTSPDSVVREVERSGLRGCGGAGFPTGRKWRAVSVSHSQTKYVICNADESEPGAFKDRVLLENDPHLLLEGMALAAYAVGANEGIIYVRGEYERSAQLLEQAVEQAEWAGWLGESIGGSRFTFQVHVHRGAGAYICGEETALLESLEGRRGEPRIRPPFPTTHGYLGRPTVVNNVETLCLVTAIVQRGGSWYQTLGAAGAPGVKLFTLSGHVRRPTVFESPLRITTRDILNRIGLGMRSGSQFKMALTGGAAGTLIGEDSLDVPLDFASIEHGVALGSGVVIVFDSSVSAADVLGWLLWFFRTESCGKCTPCREGTRTAHDVVGRIADGRGRAGDFALLRRIAKMLRVTSLCGLGQSVAMPIDSALDNFVEDFHQCGAT